MALTTVDQGLLGTNAQYTGFKNRLINGAQVIDQRNAGASVTPSSSTNTYITDRFYVYGSQASKFTAQQNAGSVTPPAGFTKYLGVTSSSAYSILSSDIFYMAQKIEGYNTADLAWGTANAATVTLSFRVYSSLTGTFGGALLNGAFNYSYPFTYSIPVANTWTTISITIAGPTSGSWANITNDVGMLVGFQLGVGSSYTGTAGTWAAASYYGATGATSVVGTSGATFYITGVQLEKGSTATSFDYRPYGTELALCQRYFNRTNPTGSAGTGGLMGCYYSSSTAAVTYMFPVTMRAAPTVTRSSAGGNGDTFWVSNISASSSGTSANVTTGTTGMWQEITGMSSAAIGYPCAYNGSLLLSAEL